MGLMADPGPDLAQPGARLADTGAERLLQAEVDEDPLYLGRLGGETQPCDLRGAETPGIGRPVRSRGRARLEGGAGVVVEGSGGRPLEHEVHVEACLMAAMAVRHGAAARLAHVADEKRG